MGHHQAPVRLLAVAPYASLAAAISRVAQEYAGMGLTTVVGDLQDGVAEARRRLGRGDFDAIVSRGGTAQLLRESVSLPVLEIPISPFDILQAIKLSEGIAGRSAIVGFEPITSVAASIDEIMQLGLDIFTLADASDVPSVMRMIVENDYQTIICDVVSGAAAREAGLNTVLVTSGAASIRKALDEAIQQAQAMRAAREENRLLHAVLRELDGSVVVLDAAGDVRVNASPYPVEGDVIDYLRSLADAVRAGEIRSVRKSMAGKLHSIRARPLSDAPDAPCAFYVSGGRRGARRIEAGIAYLTRAEAQSAYERSLYGLSGCVNRISGALLGAVQGGQPLLVSGAYGTGRTAVALYAYAHSPYGAHPLAEIDCGLLSDSSRRHLLDSAHSPLFASGMTLHIKNLSQAGDDFLRRLLSTLAQSEATRRACLIFSCNPRHEAIARHLPSIKDRFLCLEVRLMTLREQRESIPSLANLYLSQLNSELAREVLRIDARAMQLLVDYPWPGNLLQLERVTRQAYLSSQDHVIRAVDVRGALSSERPLGVGEMAGADGGVSLDLGASLHELRRQLVEEVVRRHGGNQSAAAKQLGISRTTLWRIRKG